MRKQVSTAFQTFWKNELMPVCARAKAGIRGTGLYIFLPSLLRISEGLFLKQTDNRKVCWLYAYQGPGALPPPQGSCLGFAEPSWACPGRASPGSWWLGDPAEALTALGQEARPLQGPQEPGLCEDRMFSAVFLTALGRKQAGTLGRGAARVSAGRVQGTKGHAAPGTAVIGR